MDFLTRTISYVNELQYRQAQALTRFEKICRTKNPEERQFIVGVFKYCADEMKHHGFFGYLNKRMQWTLQKEARLNAADIDNVMVAYHLAHPACRRAFKRHLLAGVVEARHHLITGRADPAFTEYRTADIGHAVIRGQEQARWNKTSQFDPLIPWRCMTRLNGGSIRRAEDILHYARQFMHAIDIDDKLLDKRVCSTTEQLWPLFLSGLNKSPVRYNNTITDKIQTLKTLKNQGQTKVLHSFLHASLWLLMTAEDTVRQQCLSVLRPRRLLRSEYRLRRTLQRMHD